MSAKHLNHAVFLCPCSIGLLVVHSTLSVFFCTFLPPYWSASRSCASLESPPGFRCSVCGFMPLRTAPHWRGPSSQHPCNSKFRSYPSDIIGLFQPTLDSSSPVFLWNFCLTESNFFSTVYWIISE
jgi:hypothetical protein